MFKSPAHPIQPTYITYPWLVVITADKYVMLRIGKNPNMPNDGAGPFANTPNYPVSNAVADWAEVKKLIEGCATNGNFAKAKTKGPYLNEMDLDDALQAAAAAGEGDELDDKNNYVFVDPNDLVPGAVHYFQ